MRIYRCSMGNDNECIVQAKFKRRQPRKMTQTIEKTAEGKVQITETESIQKERVMTAQELDDIIQECQDRLTHWQNVKTEFEALP